MASPAEETLPGGFYDSADMVRKRVTCGITLGNCYRMEAKKAKGKTLVEKTHIHRLVTVKVLTLMLDP